jgi:hypothetical protein
MKLTLEKVIGAIVVVVLGYMIYTHFLSRPTMVKIQKDRHKQSKSALDICNDEFRNCGIKKEDCQDKYANCLQNTEDYKNCEKTTKNCNDMSECLSDLLTCLSNLIPKDIRDKLIFR